MKKDPYKNEERWTKWKENHFNKNPKGTRKQDWTLLIEFLKDMELGLNTPKEKKGKRSAGTLLNLSSHNKLFLEKLNKPLLKLTKQDLHKFEQEISDGKILKQNGKKYTAFGNYIKDFKVFWRWILRTKKVDEDICEDITSKTGKPDWVYLTEEQIKKLFNRFSFEYKTLCFFFYDSGCRVTEGINIKINDFSEDYEKVTIREETSKTFERTINLKMSRELLKEYIKEKGLEGEDYLIQKKPFAINKYLRYHCGNMFGKEKVSHPKSKGKYKNFTLYSIRHNSACFWFNKYPTHKGIMYRFGWRKPDKIEYYSNFLGVSDEITDSDMVIGEDRDKLFELELENKNRKNEISKLIGENKKLKNNINKLAKKFDTVLELGTHAIK